MEIKKEIETFEHILCVSTFQNFSSLDLLDFCCRNERKTIFQKNFEQYVQD